MPTERPPISRLVVPQLWPELVASMAEGNPGAMRVVMELLERVAKGPVPFPMTVLDLDDMNIRGAQIWVAYKDACGEDLDEFIKKCRDRDEAMVETVNRESGSEWIAVTSGASAPGERKQRPST